MQLLQISFNYTLAPEDLERSARRLAPAFSEVPGLRWKIWKNDPDAGVAGGVYLFESGGDLTRYLDGPLAAEIMSNPCFSDFNVEVFDVMEAPSRITRATL